MKKRLTKKKGSIFILLAILITTFYALHQLKNVGEGRIDFEGGKSYNVNATKPNSQQLGQGSSDH